MEYKLLEPDLAKGIGLSQPSLNGASPSLFTSTSFLYVLFFVIIVVVASTKYAQAGLFRMEASESGIKKSNEVFKKTTMGLIGVFSLWLILSTVNKDLLTGDVALGALRATPGGNVTSGVISNTNSKSQSNSATSKACEPESDVKASLSSPGGICGNARCSILSGCNYQQYLPIIKSESSRLGVDYRMIVVTMCKESSANPEAHNQNQDGTYDCGLMQINQSGPCNVASLKSNTTSNITQGVEIMKKKIASNNNRVYPGFPNVNGVPVADVFASYNCCSNGTAPSSQSASCTSADGWPAIPKWACPIDPGTGKFNMCAVKAYACELTACLSQVN